MFDNKKINLILSLVAACVLWIYVVGDTNHMMSRRLSDVKIQFINREALKQSGLAIEKIETDKTDIIIEGHSNKINSFKSQDVKLIADLYGRHKGKNYVEVEVSGNKDYRVVDKTKSRILVEIGEYRTTEKPVVLQLRGRLPKNKVIREIRSLKSKITVAGAQVNLDKVAALRAEVNRDDLSDETKLFNLNIVPVDERGRKVDFIETEKNTVGVYVGLDSVKEVALSASVKGRPAEGLEFQRLEFPQNVKITGRESRLAEIDKLVCEPVDISGIKRNEDRSLKIRLPSGVRLVKNSSGLKARVILKGKKQETKKFRFTAGEIKVLNLSEELTAEVAGGVEITLSADTAMLKRIDRDGLRPEIDLKNLPAGEHKVRVKIKGLRQGVKSEITPDEISVTIKQKGENDNG